MIFRNLFKLIFLRRSRMIGMAAAAMFGCFLAPELAKSAQADGPTNEAVFVTLGTGGGPVIRRDRAEPANALIVRNSVYLFDIGNGTQRRMVEAGIPINRVRAIFLSHSHIDHTGDLAPFLINRWVLNNYAKVAVIGPRGTRDTIRGIALINRPVDLAPVTIGGPAKPKIGNTIDLRELAPRMDAPTLIYQDDNIRVLAITNNHFNYPKGSVPARYSRSYAYRIETASGSFVYSGDTGPSENVVTLARDADVLISEVIDIESTSVTLGRTGTIPSDVMPGLLAHMREDHLVPEEVGKIAGAAGVRKLVLTHLVPGNDGETDLSIYTRGISTYFKGEVVVARDLGHFRAR